MYAWQIELPLSHAAYLELTKRYYVAPFHPLKIAKH